MRPALSLLFALMLSSAAAAQEAPIFEEALGAATAFDAGALDTGDISLPSSLWQGTDAARSAALINAAPTASETPLIRAMVRAALLSPGVPPAGDRDIFEAARLRAVIHLGDEDALQTVLTRNPSLGQTPDARLSIALARGDRDAACNISDSITTDRAAPQWARLRAVCHVLREEIPAAELTRDLLQSGGLDDKPYFALLAQMMGGKASAPAPSDRDDALIHFMRAQLRNTSTKADALNAELSPEKRLSVVWERLVDFEASELTAIMSDLAFDQNDIAGSSSFDLESAKANRTPQGTAQLYQLAQSGNAAAYTELSMRAGAASGALIRIMREPISRMPAADQAKADLSLFAKAAVERRDVAVLQDIYRATDDAQAQSRIALAADALGGGYQGRPMGTDIETRISSEAGSAKRRAQRDAAIALALGAQLSSAVREGLAEHTFPMGRKIPAGDLMIMQSAAEAGAVAEVVLLSAGHLEGRALNAASLSAIIRALRQVGQNEMAGQVAATDFIHPL